MYRVMIVEDDDIIAGTVKKHLEQCGPMSRFSTS